MLWEVCYEFHHCPNSVAALLSVSFPLALLPLICADIVMCFCLVFCGNVIVAVMLCCDVERMLQDLVELQLLRLALRDL